MQENTSGYRPPANIANEAVKKGGMDRLTSLITTNPSNVAVKYAGIYDADQTTQPPNETPVKPDQPQQSLLAKRLAEARAKSPPQSGTTSTSDSGKVTRLY